MQKAQEDKLLFCTMRTKSHGAQYQIYFNKDITNAHWKEQQLQKIDEDREERELQRILYIYKKAR